MRSLPAVAQPFSAAGKVTDENANVRTNVLQIQIRTFVIIRNSLTISCIANGNLHHHTHLCDVAVEWRTELRNFYCYIHFMRNFFEQAFFYSSRNMLD
jgi:hypothetical protein